MQEKREDSFTRAMLNGGCIRLLSISARNMVQQAKDTHGLSRVATAALGRQLMATCMMAAELKREGESLTTIFSGGGPLGNMVCTGRYGAYVKGYVVHPVVELPLNAQGKLDVSRAVGASGQLKVTRDLSLKEPYTGAINLVSGEIAEDFAQYFTISEQQPSLVYLGVRLRPDSGEVLSAGGLIAQAMPGFPQEEIDRAADMLEARAAGIATLAERLELAPLQDVLYALFYDMELHELEETLPRFLCDCSRARTEQALIALGISELTDMLQEDHGAELTCQFCNHAYNFSAEDLSALINEATAGRIHRE